MRIGESYSFGFNNVQFVFSSLKCPYLFICLLKNPDVVHPKEATPLPTFTGIRPARVVSSTSEEEEAFTEKFLKINCRYITSGKVISNTSEKNFNCASLLKYLIFTF